MTSIRRKPSGGWEARYRDPNGRQRGKTFPTKVEARRFLERAGADKQRGAWVDPKHGRVTLARWADGWLDNRPELRPRTRELYRGLLDNHILPSLGSVELARLAPSAVRSWHARLLARHPSTAAKAYRLLAAMMTTAVADGVLVKSPCQVRGASQEHAPERPMASIVEVEALAENMPERLRLLVLLAAWCGLRRGELLALRLGDFDFMRGTVRIERSSYQMRDGTITCGPPKTEAGRHTVAIPPHVVPFVANHVGTFVSPDPER